MKFWHKIFIGTLVIFMLAFDAGTFFLTSYAYDFNRRKESENAVREQDVILSSVAGRISSTETFYPDASHESERLSALMRPLAAYYAQQGVLLSLYNDGKSVYTDLADMDAALLSLESTKSKNVMEQTIDSRRHVLVASQLPDYPHLIFVYTRDISGIDDFRADVGRIFLFMNAVVFVFGGILVYLLLKRMTKPITELTALTAEIAGGAYGKRITVRGSDELALLAHSFNRMADATERHLTWLTNAAEEKQQFIDDLAHEMRTPMTSILGYSDYLKNANCTEEERVMAAGHLYDMASRLKSLSEKLLELTFSRGETIELTEVDIKTLFEKLEDMIRPVLSPRRLNMITDVDITRVKGDETLLLSMLQNLVENAARASEDGASVAVSAYNRQDCAVIEVADNGCGMEKSEADKITAPFYRVDKSRSRTFGGVGLGLSIVSQIAALHGAKIDIESALGAGTSVKICFITP